MLCPLFLSAVHKLFMKDLRENKDYADIFKNSSLQQKYIGFEINQQLFTLCDHQLAMVMLEFKNLIL